TEKCELELCLWIALGHQLVHGVDEGLGQRGGGDRLAVDERLDHAALGETPPRRATTEVGEVGDRRQTKDDAVSRLGLGLESFRSVAVRCADVFDCEIELQVLETCRTGS